MEEENARELAAIKAILKVLEDEGLRVSQGIWVLEKAKDAVQMCSPCRAENVSLRFGTYLYRGD